MAKAPIAIHYVRYLVSRSPKALTAGGVAQLSGLAYVTCKRALHTLLGFKQVSELPRVAVERRFEITPSGVAVHAALPADFRDTVEKFALAPMVRWDPEVLGAFGLASLMPRE